MEIKFDVSNTEPGQASGGEPPKPGLYTAELHEIKYRTDRGDGKEDDLECIYRILDDETLEPDNKYGRVWDYVGLQNETTEWKRAQFFEAIGVATDDKRTGSFNPKEHCIKFNGQETDRTKGTRVKLRIKADSYQGDYKAKIAAVLPLPADGEDGGDEDPFA